MPFYSLIHLPTYFLWRCRVSTLGEPLFRPAYLWRYIHLSNWGTKGACHHLTSTVCRQCSNQSPSAQTQHKHKLFTTCMGSSGPV